MSDSELKPCPFCGGDVELTTRLHSSDKLTEVMIDCDDCFAEMVEFAYIDQDSLVELKNKMIAMWNSRHQPERETEKEKK